MACDPCKDCTSSKHSCRRPFTNLRLFRTESFSRACSTTSPTGKVGKCRSGHLRRKIQTWLFVFLWSTTRTDLVKKRRSTISRLALGMMSEFIFSKHPVFTCSNILQTSVLMKRKRGGGAGTHLKSEPENHLMLVSMTLAYNQLCLFSKENVESEQVASSDSYFHRRIESGRSYSVISPQTTSLCIV